MIENLRRYRLARRIVAGLALLAVAGLGACFEGKDKKEEPSPTPEMSTAVTTTVTPTTHTLYITPAADNPAQCTIADAKGNTVIQVLPGDTVQWINQFGPDVRLTFGSVKQLFGINQATVSQTGGPFNLRVRDDADQSQHDYNSSCGGGMGGPGLIVCPPNGGPPC